MELEKVGPSTEVALPVLHSLAIPAMTDEAISQVVALEQWNLARPQQDIQTDHFLHAGEYVRTVFIPKDVLVTGALVKVATVLFINGDVTVYIDGEPARIAGYAIVRADAYRKQVFWAHADTHLTMSFATGATTLEDAEDEFTDEAGRLITRTNVETGE